MDREQRLAQFYDKMTTCVNRNVIEQQYDVVSTIRVHVVRESMPITGEITAFPKKYGVFSMMLDDASLPLIKQIHARGLANAFPGVLRHGVLVDTCYPRVKLLMPPEGGWRSCKR